MAKEVAMFNKIQIITRVALISILSVLFLIGCSSGRYNTPPVGPDDTPTSPETTANSIPAGYNTHHLLVYSLINIYAIPMRHFPPNLSY